jgi:hypothetical protein
MQLGVVLAENYERERIIPLPLLCATSRKAPTAKLDLSALMIKIK